MKTAGERKDQEEQEDLEASPVPERYFTFGEKLIKLGTKLCETSKQMKKVDVARRRCKECSNPSGELSDRLHKLYLKEAEAFKVIFEYNILMMDIVDADHQDHIALLVQETDSPMCD